MHLLTFILTREWLPRHRLTSPLLMMALFHSDHAQLFIMSAIVAQLHKQGKPLDPASTVEYFPNCDKHGAASTLHRSSATNIYKTKDGRFFHTHGSYLAS